MPRSRIAPVCREPPSRHSASPATMCAPYPFEGRPVRVPPEATRLLVALAGPMRFRIFQRERVEQHLAIGQDRPLCASWSTWPPACSGMCR